MTSPDISATPLAPFAGTWTLDPTNTSVAFNTKAMWGLVKVKGSFRPTEGSAIVGADGSVSGSLSLDATSVDTGVKKRDDHLRSADFFEADSYPSMTFDAAAAVPNSAGGFDVTGTFTVRGQSRPISFSATAQSVDEGVATVATEFDLDRSQWGITFAKMGARMVNHVVISARFTKTA
jgi:polyisoprenoid-binding protein YceI